MNRISIIITVYNETDTLRRAVRSALASTWEDVEVLVVDDGSTADVRAGISDLMQQHEHLVYLRQTNQGLGAARDLGARSASGQWLAFLDADDEIAPDKLAAQWAALQDAPEGAIVFSGSIVISEGGGRRERCTFSAAEEVIDISGGYISGRIKPNGATMFMAKETYLAIGGFDPAIRRNSEFEFMVRAISRGVCFYLANQALYIVHQSAASNRHRSSHRLESWRRIMAKLDALLAGEIAPDTRAQVLAYARSKLFRNIWLRSLDWERAERNALLNLFSGTTWLPGKYRMLFAATQVLPTPLARGAARLIRFVGGGK